MIGSGIILFNALEISSSGRKLFAFPCHRSEIPFLGWTFRLSGLLQHRLRRHGYLFQNSGSWSLVKATRRAQDPIQNDKRIYGDSEYIQIVSDSIKRNEKIVRAEP